MNSAGDRSVISNDMQELREGGEEISHKIQGHKANLSNPSMNRLYMSECRLQLLTVVDRHQPGQQGEQQEGDRGAGRRREPLRQQV
jgi:hypothetical protein